MGNTLLRHLLLCLALMVSSFVSAQLPSCSPTASYLIEDEWILSADTVASAPVKLLLQANVENAESVQNLTLTWKFYKETLSNTPYLTRQGEEMEWEFTESGTHLMQLVMTYYDSEQGEVEEVYDPMRIQISVSKLEFPNAFSPNGDGINDIYRAKEGWQSIVEFHAYIFNRWGHKVYEWTDLNGGWDGKIGGKDAKEGTYFALIKAKGADGRKFEIKRDVNLLRGFTQAGSNVSE